MIKDAVDYICTPADVRGAELTYDEFRDAVSTATADLLRLGPATRFSAEEDAATAGFVQAVSADDWVARVSSRRFAAAHPGAGFANLKVKKLIRCGVALEQDTIVAVMVAGDMHVSPPEAMDRVARAIRHGRQPRPPRPRARVAAVLGAPDVTQPDAAAGITADDLVECVMLAAKGAR